MIEKPKIGMRVLVTNSKHCSDEEHNGVGTITEIDGEDSFLVKMDKKKLGSWYHCRDCVDEL